MGTVLVYDAIGSNFGHLPEGHVAGYVTGSQGIPWTAQQFTERPGAVRIDQTPADTVWDATADVDDMEKGAVTLSELAPRAKARIASFNAGAHPGQRRPAIYCSRSTVTRVVNALISGGVTSGVGLWIADWDDDQAKAEAEVANGSGPFPVIGRQFKSEAAYDVSVFSTEWLAATSASPLPVAVPQPPPGQWHDPRAWTWRDVMITGQGLNGGMYSFVFNTVTGKWSPT